MKTYYSLAVLLLFLFAAQPAFAGFAWGQCGHDGQHGPGGWLCNQNGDAEDEVVEDEMEGEEVDGFTDKWRGWRGFPFRGDSPWDGVFDKWRDRGGFPLDCTPKDSHEVPAMWSGWHGWKGFMGCMFDDRVNDHFVDWHDRFVERYDALDPEDPEYDLAEMIESHQRLVDRYGRFLDRHEDCIDSSQQAIDRLTECIDGLEEPSDRLIEFYDSLIEKHDEKVLTHDGYLAYHEELLAYQDWLHEDTGLSPVTEPSSAEFMVSAVPEPSTLTMLGMAGLAILGYLFLKRK